MGMIDEPLPITEPYSPVVKPVLTSAWEAEKARLEDGGVTIPVTSEALARRTFMAGYVAALNASPY